MGFDAKALENLDELFTLLSDISGLKFLSSNPNPTQMYITIIRQSKDKQSTWFQPG
jgi:hypothetical protein